MVYEQYGAPDVLELRDVPQPETGGDELLIRVRAASVNRSDWEALTARPAYVRLSGSGVRKPRVPILGSDIAGIVEAVGDQVTRFKPGDEVLGDIIWHGARAFAEYITVRRTPHLP
jgi:NADPH:quinone reductase-like Zn-dependent oxidoreductase